MRRKDCLEYLAELHEDELIICTLGRTAGEWWDVRQSTEDDTFYQRSAMGMVSSMALGLALALPHRRIWAFDGDGGLALNLSSLLTLGAVRPANLVHIVWFNRQYDCCGNQPLGIDEAMDLQIMATGAGIRNTATLRTPDEFRDGMAKIVKSDGYQFVVAEVEGSGPIVDGSPMYPIDITYRFGSYIERSEGITVFKAAAKKTL